MISRDYSIAEELKHKLSSFIQIVDFRVFGSRARGNYDEYSDLDIYIVVKEINKELEEKISETVWEVGFNHYILISPLVFTLDEIQNTPQRSSPIVQNIQREGVPV